MSGDYQKLNATGDETATSAGGSYMPAGQQVFQPPGQYQQPNMYQPQPPALIWIHEEFADDLVNYINANRERIFDEQNVNLAALEDSFRNPLKVQELIQTYESVLTQKGIPLDQPIAEDRWAEICQEVYRIIQEKNTWGTLPYFNEDIVTRFYYVFNCISFQYRGVTGPKIQQTIKSYFERKSLKRNSPDDQGVVMCEDPEASILCGRRQRSTILKCLYIFFGLYLVCLLLLYLLACNPVAIRSDLNMQSGWIGNKMQRKVVNPRPNREYGLVDNNIHYGNELALEWSSCEGDAYWNEEGMVELSKDAEKELLEASYELYNLCLEAVDQIVKDDALLALFTINEALWPAIRESWDKSHTDFMGRFDLAYDGKSPPKLIEFNADTPSLQLESSILQEYWMKDKFKFDAKHQSNFMAEAFRRSVHRMIQDCNGYQNVENLGISQVSLDEENYAVMSYFNKMVKNLTHSLQSKSFLHDIGDLKIKYIQTQKDVFKPVWSFKEVGNQKNYECLFNNYPKEWLSSEVPQDELSQHDFKELRSFEPYWKLILGNKALLPYLWQMRPGHPNLLPSFYDDPKSQIGEVEFNKLQVKEWVSKPLFGREGMGVFFSKMFPTYSEFVRKTQENYGYEDTLNNKKPLGVSIYQAEAELPVAQGRIIQTGSWIVNGMPAGLIFREGKAGTHFSDYEPFLVHAVNDASMLQLDFKLNKNQANIRNKLYKGQVVGGSEIYSKYGGRVSVQQTENLYSNGAQQAPSVPYTKWNSYSVIQHQVKQKQALRLDLSDQDINILRGKYYHDNDQWAWDKSSDKVNVFLKRHRFNYGGRATRFGYYSKIDNNGEGQWFSSDRNGVVRTHHYHSGGFGYHIGG